MYETVKTVNGYDIVRMVGTRRLKRMFIQHSTQLRKLQRISTLIFNI